MRSLAAQLVALALAVSITTVASSYASDNKPVHSEGGRTSVPARGGHSTCRAYCQARLLRHQLVRVHGRTVALARSAALPLISK